MPKRALMTVGIWAMVSLLVPLFGCGGGGTKTDLATVPVTPPPAAGAAPTFTFATPSFSPTSGGAGLVVTITATSGTGTSTDLSSVTAVTFAGPVVTPVYQYLSLTSITVKVPQGARNGLISLKGGVNTLPGTSATTFEVEPVVTGVSNPNIVPGRSLTIVGRNFCVASAVTFNTTTVNLDQPVAECAGSSNTQTRNTTLTVTLPASVVLPLLVSVTTPSGSGTASPSLTISATSNQPTIATGGVSPANGGAGVLVSITGTFFMGGGTLASLESVIFFGVPTTANFTLVSDTLVSVVVPTGARNGLISVFVANKNVGQSGTSFLAEPIVTGFTPNLARPGVTTITVLGSNFCSASVVTFNTLTSTVSASANACAGTDRTSVTATLPGVAVPVTLVSVTTPSGAGQANILSSYAPVGSTTNTRIALLQSFRPGGSLGSFTAIGQVGTGNLARLVLASTNALYSLSLDGQFLGSVVTTGTAVALAAGGLTSIYATTLDSVILAWEGFSTVTTRTIGPGLLVSTEPPAMHPKLGPITVAQTYVWAGDTNASLGSLWSINAGVAAGATLFSLTLAPNQGAVRGTGFSQLGGLDSVWVVTSLGSVYVVEAPGAVPTVRTVGKFNASSPAGLAFGLGSVWIAGGDALGVLASTGAGLLTSFNLNTLQAWGGGIPLVSVLVFDRAATPNLWYADAGQKVIVLRCTAAAGFCASGGGSLISFSLATVGGAPPGQAAGARTLFVDSLGSLWFDEVSPDTGGGAVERLIP